MCQFATRDMEAGAGAPEYIPATDPLQMMSWNSYTKVDRKERSHDGVLGDGNSMAISANTMNM